MKPVMYHYVRPAAPGMPHFPYLALSDFERQLDYFAEHYGFISRRSFEVWRAGVAAPDGVLLTFDDGLRDHVDFVLPLLAEREIFALFYVPSLPITDNAFLDVHKVHLALGRIGGPAALKWLEQNAREHLDRGDHLDAASYARQKSDGATKRVKRLFNWALSADERQEILEGLLTYAWDGAMPHWRDFYLDETGVRRLCAAGMGVGAHGHRHLLLSRLTTGEQRQEISASCALVDTLTGGINWGYCYAHGDFDETSEHVLAELGCPFAFAVEPCDIVHPLKDSGRFALPRYNCNAFPFGDARYTAAVEIP